LSKSVGKLEQHKDKLQEFFATGGIMNYFIGLYGARKYGLVFPIALMSRLASAGVELQLDVYPSESAT